MKKFLTSIALCATLSMALMVPAFAERNTVNNGTDFGNRTFIGTNAVDNNGDGLFDGADNNNRNNNRMNNFNTNGRNNNNNNNNGNFRARAAGNNNNDGVDWGWLGLLGLIGLAGMRNRNRQPS